MKPGTVLQGDLARHLQDCGFLTFTEIEIRGTEADGWGTGRVDVVAIKPHHYARKDLRAYECKQRNTARSYVTSASIWIRLNRRIHLQSGGSMPGRA